MTACNMFITTSIKAYLEPCSSHTEILPSLPQMSSVSCTTLACCHLNQWSVFPYLVGDTTFSFEKGSCVRTVKCAVDWKWHILNMVPYYWAFNHRTITQLIWFHRMERLNKNSSLLSWIYTSKMSNGHLFAFVHAANKCSI